MRWVTYYYSVLRGIEDFEIHKDKKTATRYFNKHFKDYFQVNTPFSANLPCTYGFVHRMFVGESIRSFNISHHKETK